MVVSEVSRYLDVKSISPSTTDAYLVLPRVTNAPWFPLTKRMIPVGCHRLSSMCATVMDTSDDIMCQIWYDPCRASPGSLPLNGLPSQLQALSQSQNGSRLTFVFDGKVAGVGCSVLWDSGAAHSFISKDFVRLHKLRTITGCTDVQLADGSVMRSSEIVTFKLRLQAHSSTCRFIVIDMVPGFDVVLGDDWSHKNQVVANYGCATSGVAAHLWLRKSKCSLFPGCVPCPSDVSETGPISAHTAARLLMEPRFGAASPFVVLLRKQDEAPPHPPPQRNERLAQLLSDYEDVFAAPSLLQHGASSLGDITPECIPTIPGSIPVNRPPFRLSVKEKAEIERQVNVCLDNGWVELSSSAYGAPVLFVPKPDGTLRMCIDYRPLNKITVKNKFPMPRIDDLIENLNGATYLSTLDLAAGYHQLKLKESDVPKTAFNTHFGKFEWRVMPFGLTSAPAVFQHAMNRVFGAHLNCCVCVYLDNILLFSRSEEEHFRHLEMVLQLLREHELFAKMRVESVSSSSLSSNTWVTSCLRRGCALILPRWTRWPPGLCPSPWPKLGSSWGWPITSASTSEVTRPWLRL